MKTAEENSTRINWQYCECGCHGHELRLGPAHYWMDSWKKRDGKKVFYLNYGHQYGDTIGTYGSFEEADGVARKHAEIALKEARVQLVEDQARALLDLERGEAGL